MEIKATTTFYQIRQLKTENPSECPTEVQILRAFCSILPHLFLFGQPMVVETREELLDLATKLEKRGIKAALQGSLAKEPLTE